MAVATNCPDSHVRAWSYDKLSIPALLRLLKNKIDSLPLSGFGM